MAKTESKESAIHLLSFIYKNRKILIFTGLIAGVVASVISLFLPILYESSAIVFPTATSTVSFNSSRNVKAGAMDFGVEEDAEQLIQILESSPLRNRIIKEFDLAKAYGIDPKDERFYYKLKTTYNERIKFNRTRYGSINISVLDKSPQLAADIANKIVELIDTLKNDLIKERTVPAFEINRRKLSQLQAEQEKLNKELDSLSLLGVVDERSRASLFTAINEAKNEEDRKLFREQIKANLRYGARYDALSDLRKSRIDKLTIQETSYEQAESDAAEDFTHKFVVESAFPSDKKAKPERAIIVLVSTLSAEILMFILLLIRERIREIKHTK